MKVVFLLRDGISSSFINKKNNVISHYKNLVWENLNRKVLIDERTDTKKLDEKN
jgi:hypothetical protein